MSKLARQGAVVSAATMLSRVLGLLREMIFAALVGAGTASDAFVAAFRIPNLLRDLFAEGALSSAFVPEFKKELERSGTARAMELGNRVATTVAVIVGALTVLGVVFAPSVVGLMAGRFADVPGKGELTIYLARIMMPFLVVVSLAAVAMGMLNAQEKFAWPALAPALFNVVSIATGFGLWLWGAEPVVAVIGWSVGTLAGGIAQLVVQLPALWRTGYRPRWLLDLRAMDPSMRRIAKAMGPAVVGVAAVQVNIFVNTAFAASEPGAVTWLNFAFRFLYLPIGVFGVAIATVSTTRYAKATAHQDVRALAEHLSEGLRMVAFLCVPATLGLWAIGEPLTRLIYQYGKFTPEDTAATTIALNWYAIGLVAYAGVKVVAPAFYALGRARIAMIASLLAVAANVAANWILHPTYGYKVLALGTAIAALVNGAVLCGVFHFSVARLAWGAMLHHFARVVLAACAAAGAAYGVNAWLLVALGDMSRIARLAEVGVPVVVAVTVYGALAVLLRLPEVARLRRGRG